jgi:hypothetical protein
MEAISGQCTIPLHNVRGGPNGLCESMPFCFGGQVSKVLHDQGRKHSLTASSPDGEMVINSC